MPFEPRLLGRTGLRVSPLGLGASYGVPAGSIERAFDEGINYLYWGSLRRGGMKEALCHLRSRRDSIVLVMQSFSRVASLIQGSVERGLRRIGYERADILLLGLWNGPPPERILDAGRAIRERGLVRHLGISSHHRPLIAKLAAGGDFDVLHFRYNAAHPGAEADIFPYLRESRRPGTVAYTATNWGRLLRARPDGEPSPTSADCYRFALTRPEVDVCLCGPANAAEMDDALKVLRSNPMKDDELAWMRRAGRS